MLTLRNVEVIFDKSSWSVPEISEILPKNGSLYRLSIAFSHKLLVRLTGWHIYISVTRTDNSNNCYFLKLTRCWIDWLRC
jgi:hypothetical protein